jgi:hypothetical protein
MLTANKHQSSAVRCSRILIYVTRQGKFLPVILTSVFVYLSGHLPTSTLEPLGEF